MVNLMHVTAALNHKVLKETAKRQSVAMDAKRVNTLHRQLAKREGWD